MPCIKLQNKNFPPQNKSIVGHLLLHELQKCGRNEMKLDAATPGGSYAVY